MSFDRWLIAAVLAVASTTAVAEDVVLRWKFEPGQESDYVVGRRRQALLDLNGNELEITFATTSDVHWKVDSVENGKANITASIERLQLEVKSPIEEFTYDSVGDEPQASALWEEIRDRILKLLKSPIKIVADARGQIDSITFVPEVTEAMAQPSANPQVERFLAGVLDERGIKNILSQTFIPLPEGAATIGGNWEVTEEVPRPPFGTQIVLRKMTYAGRDEGSGDVNTITLGSHLDFKMAEGEGTEGFSLKMSEQEGKGTAQFDSQQGRLRQMDFVQTVKMDIAMNGTDIVQNITETMTLAEGKSPPAEPATSKPEGENASPAGEEKTPDGAEN